MKTIYRFTLVVALFSLACSGEPTAEDTPSATPAAATPDATSTAPASGSPAVTSGAPVAGDVVLETEQQKIFYALGLAMSESLPQFELTEADLAYVFAGIRDRALERPTLLEQSEYSAQLAAYSAQKYQEAVAAEPARAAAFLAQTESEAGVEKTSSGLLYFELTPGSGASPAPIDTVVVHYMGSLRNGVVFDSSYDRGQPATVVLTQVIPCWAEGLRKMKVGGKSRLVCPSELAYGDRGAPPKILPGAALVFDVELADVQ